jgi:GT2 family glycosyltransferase
VVKRGLKSIYEISLPIELIVVDNASTDSSFEEILSYLSGLEGRDFKVKFIRLGKNMGYTGGNNIGYLNSDPKTKGCDNLSPPP